MGIFGNSESKPPEAPSVPTRPSNPPPAEKERGAPAPAAGGEDFLVPLVRDAVRSVDVEAKVVDVDVAFLGDTAPAFAREAG